MVKTHTYTHSQNLVLFSFALCYCTAELLSSRGRPSSFRKSSVFTVFSEPVKQINAKFGRFRKRTWNHMGEKTLNDIFLMSEIEVHNRFASKHSCILGEGSLPKLYKELWNLKFWFLANCFVLIFFLERSTWQSMGNYKMCDILKNAGRRAQRTKHWTSGVSLVYT